MSESTATVAALLSAELASRRKRVLNVYLLGTMNIPYDKGAHLHAVVRTVNHVYAAIVATVIAAKFHPKL